MSTSARTPQGDIQLPRVVVSDTAKCIAQDITDGLNLWQAEWFLNRNVGFPWLQKVLGQKIPNLTQINLLLTQFIMKIQGVVNVQASATYNPGQRSYAYTYKAWINTGEILTGGTGQPITITGG